MAGEIAPDRPYFHDKVQNLHDVVRLMVRRRQDIERWLRACDATVDHPGEGGRTIVGTCERPSGHATATRLASRSSSSASKLAP